MLLNIHSYIVHKLTLKINVRHINNFKVSQ